MPLDHDNGGSIAGLSLVLATIGRVDEIGRFFDSIPKSARYPLEVIVVDQNEDNRLLPLIDRARTQGLTICHLRLDRKGLSYARNIGLRSARYGIVGFPDDDCWYEDQACEEVLARFQSAIHLDGLLVRWADRHAEHHRKIRLDWHKQKQFRGVPIASICLFLRRDLLLEAGGFDDRLGVGEWFGSSEETDLMLRLLAQGRVIFFDPDIRVRHHWSGAAVDTSANARSIFLTAKVRARGTGAIYAKHPIDKWIVAKGLLAPIAKALTMRKGIRGAVYWCGTFFGRWQGFLEWKKLAAHD